MRIDANMCSSCASGGALHTLSFEVPALVLAAPAEVDAACVVRSSDDGGLTYREANFTLVFRHPDIPLVETVNPFTGDRYGGELVQIVVSNVELSVAQAGVRLFFGVKEAAQSALTVGTITSGGAEPDSWRGVLCSR